MTQQTSPFIEGKYGWALGEGNWNLGMDENLLKFSYLFDRNIDGIVSSLPAAVNGTSYFNTTDNRIYFAAGGVYSSTPVPKWFEVTLRTTGQVYQFDGSTLSLKLSETVFVEDFGAVGDGSTTAGAQINLALASGAKVVNLKGGATYLLETDLHIYSGTTLRGNGAKLITLSDLDFMIRNNDIDLPNYTGGSNIIITNVVFDGQGVTRQTGGIGLAHTTNTLIKECVFTNMKLSTFHCIDAAGNEFLTVQNCVFDNCSGATILQVDAATVGSMPTLTPPFLEILSGTRSRNILITGNKFKNCGVAEECIHLHKKGHSGITITDNQFDNCFRAIADDIGSTYRANGPTTDIIIKGNRINTTLTGGGIFLDFVKRVVISDNIVEGTGGGIQVINFDSSPKSISGITNANPGVISTPVAHGYSNGNVIYLSGIGGTTQLNNRYFSVDSATTNTFTLIDLSTSLAVDTTSYGVYTSGGVATFKNFTSGSRSEDVLIQNNIIRATNSDGIIVENCADVSVKNNIINEYGEFNDSRSAIKFDTCFPIKCSGNTIASLTSGTKFGIALHRSYRYRISENIIDRARHAIFVENLNETNPSRGTISNNTMILGTVFPLYIKGTSTFPVSRITITGNSVVGQFGGNAIRIESGSNLTIGNNTIEQVATSATGISLSLCSRCTITGNVITAQAGSSGTGIAVFGSGSSGRSTVTGNVIELFAIGVDILTSSANYGTVVGNMFIGITGAVTSVGAGVTVANNTTE